MAFEDLDEQERARRKKEQVEWRTKKNTSNMFMFASSLIEILFAIILMIALIAVISLFMFNVFDKNSEAFQLAFMIIMIAVFVVSVFLAFFFYKKLGRWIIKKFNLQDKLLDEVLEHYKIKTKEDKKEEIKSELSE